MSSYFMLNMMNMASSTDRRLLIVQTSFFLLFASLLAAVANGQVFADRRVADVREAVFENRTVVFEVRDGLAIVEGDIVLGPADSLKTRDVPAKFDRNASVINESNRRWPGGIVPYVINPDVPNPQRVTEAIRIWNETNAIRFVPRDAQQNYVRVRRATNPQCSADLGMRGGEQFVTLWDTCSLTDTIHEFGHTIGLWHETQRADRDQHVNIRFDAMDRANFLGGHSLTGGNEIGPYDYSSVMHYGKLLDATDGRPVIESIPPGIPIDYPRSPFVSAALAEAVKRLYAPSTSTVITTNPPGLEFIADGVRYKGPQSFAWAQGSTHSLDVPIPQGEGNTRYVFGSWSNAGPKSHAFQTSANGEVLILNFIRQFRVRTQIAPADGGSLSISPPSEDGYYNEGTRLVFTAAPRDGYLFETWYGSVDHFESRQGLGANPATVYLMNPDPMYGAGFRQNFVTTITTEPPGLEIEVDGVRRLGPFRPNNWSLGSTHTISGRTHLGPRGASRWVFEGWSDGGEASRTITHRAPSQVFVARFKPQHLLTINAPPDSTITASPASPDGFYDQGAEVRLLASSSQGLAFRTWTWDLSGSENPKSLKMEGQKFVGARWGGTLPPVVLSAPARLTVGVDSGERLTESFSLTSGELQTEFSVVSESPWLSVKADRTSTPAIVTATVDATQLSPGMYRGQIRIASPAVSNLRMVEVELAVANRKPLISSVAVANAASFSVGPVAPGQIITIFGTNMGQSTLTGLQVGAEGRLVTELAGTRVWFDDSPAPLIYVSAGQISAIVPYSVSSKSVTDLRVEFNGSRSFPASLPVIATHPGLFTLNSSGRGQCAALNQDFSVNSPENPAPRGSFVALYGTGEGQTSPPGVDGQVASEVLPKPAAQVTVQIGGRNAEIAYAGAAPGAVSGVFQVNVRIPIELAPGNHPVVVRIGNIDSQSGTTIAVR
jgi:uncharacterized protein (TIGR03437 family)